MWQSYLYANFPIAFNSREPRLLIKEAGKAGCKDGSSDIFCEAVGQAEWTVCITSLSSSRC